TVRVVVDLFEDLGRSLGRRNVGLPGELFRTLNEPGEGEGFFGSEPQRLLLRFRLRLGRARRGLGAGGFFGSAGAGEKKKRGEEEIGSLHGSGRIGSKRPAPEHSRELPLPQGRSEIFGANAPERAPLSDRSAPSVRLPESLIIKNHSEIVCFKMR